MTQEVKECITNYKEQDSLICELRSLFERLSNGKERSLSTVQLTSQLKLNVHEQRDIEECFRSLVNKLNSKVDQEHNILKIYQVTMFNSLKCLKCAKSMDEDTVFLDIPLSVCSANAAEKFDSMEKSLEQFLKEEKMEGDNKCYCTNCEMKTETSSRYYFKHLPQILTFQLKRFEFDYNYMAFQKITDCITVPPVLEFTRSQTQLNNARNNCHVDFVEENVTPVQHQEVNQEDSEVFTGRNPETPQDHSQQVSTGQEVNNAENHWHLVIEKDGDTADQYQEVNQEDSEVFTGRNPATPQDHSQKVSTGQEEKKYELFAIWHHSGIYGSGHYYAEIKSKSGDWYNFNDENVKKENINLSSKTAYMLMYRLTDTKLKAEARLREQRQEDAYAGGKRRREEANANEGHGGGKRRREEEEQKARHDGVESQGIPDV
ncbi:ubiquitin carboxyl-terminal hydrolase 47-like [Hemitrygon akajei]|uniref:ubiquitin carboxyl-terminal hydrolase 47-like n=1 Tax=Hemitrygon akajei TaxID=2704970 RepID=UPI003BFA2D05